MHGIVADADCPRVARIGKQPGPIFDDYGRRIADQQAWVAEIDAVIAGPIVLEAADGAVHRDHVALVPAADGV